MKKGKQYKRAISLVLTFVVPLVALFCGCPAIANTPEETRNSVVWDFTVVASWTQKADLAKMPFDMPGLVGNYGSQQWVSDANDGLMTVGGGVFVAKVFKSASLNIEYSGSASPKIGVGPTANGPFTDLDVTPVLNDEIYTISVESIGKDNSYIRYTFPENAGWGDYFKHKLRTFTYTEPEKSDDEEQEEKGVLWDFTENSAYTQKSDLNDMPFDMPGLVGNYGSQSWISQNNMGLMTVVGGVFVANVPANASLIITYAGKGAPKLSVGSSISGPWTDLTVEPVLNNGIYTITVDGIGESNRYVSYQFPSNSGWSDYAYHQLRTFNYIGAQTEPVEPIGTTWDFTGYAGYTQKSDLKDMPFDMPGLVGNYGSQSWISQNNMGLMAVGGGAFVANVGLNASLLISYIGKGTPKISVSGSISGPWTNLDIEPVLSGGIYTITVDEIGKSNRYVSYQFPSNGGWSDYAYHQLRTFTYIEPETEPEDDDKATWDFTGYSGYTQKTDLKDMPFDMPELSGNYGSQSWISQSNMGLMTVGGGVMVFKTAYNSPLKIVFSVNKSNDTRMNGGLPKIDVSASTGGPWTSLKFEPVVDGTTYKVTIDGIGKDKCYVQYTFPENAGWSAYDLHKLQTVTFEQFSGGAGTELQPPAALNAPEFDTRIDFNKFKNTAYWDFRECFKYTNNLFYGGIDRGVFPANMPYDAAKASLTFRVGKNSPVLISYTQNATQKKPKYYVSNDSKTWTEVTPAASEKAPNGDIWELVDSVGEMNVFFRFEFPQTGDDINAGQSWILSLQSILYNTTNGAAIEIEKKGYFGDAKGATFIDLTSAAWSQHFNLAKFPEIVGTSGTFVSDKQGYMRLDIDWSTFEINTDNKSNVQFVMAENSKVAVDVTVWRKTIRPKFYVSSNQKDWTAIEPTNVIYVGEDSQTAEEDYLYRYIFDGIGKSNIFFKFEFTLKKGDQYAWLALRNISFFKNNDYVPPEEPICNTAIYFDAQVNHAYYDFRACEGVTDNMFWGGGERGVFPCTMPSTGGQPGVIVKVNRNSPVVVRYTDIGLGKKPIYAVSKDKMKWDIVENDWSAKDERGDVVDVFNDVGADNMYFRFEFPQNQKNMDDSQGWLLVLQSIYFNKYIDSGGDSGEEEIYVPEETEDYDSYFNSDTPNESNKKTSQGGDKLNLWWIWVAGAVLVCGGAAALTIVLLKKKSKRMVSK